MKKYLLLLSALLVFHFTVNAQDDKITVKGEVTDASTEDPLPGANVIEKGTSNGTATDFDGNFELDVESDAALEISFLGYGSKEISVEGQTEIEIKLEEASENELEEVVVTGYTEQSRAKSTSAISDIGEDELKDITTPDVGSMLEGKASGVNVTNTVGQPGQKADITIRGLSSINGSTNPLWVVDNTIQHEAPDLNPEEVESVSVLKDASATALYGSRGANGVIVVTTKTGNKEESSISLSSKMGIAKMSTGNFDLMNSQELYDYYQQFSNPDAIPNDIDEDVLNTNYNWLDNGTHNGLTQDHNISLTGGDEKTKTFFNMGYYSEEGTVKGYDYDKFTSRLNLDYDVNDKLTFSPKVSLDYSRTKDQQHSIYDMYTNLPWDSPYDEEGNVINPEESGVEWFSRNTENYLYDLQWNYGRSNKLDLSTNLDLEYKITPNLKFVSTNNFKFNYNKSKDYVDPESVAGEADNGSLDESVIKQKAIFTNQMLKYSKDFGKHDLSALIGYEFNTFKKESTGGKGKGLAAGSSILDITAKPDDVYGGRSEYAVQSFLSNINYSYDDRYLAQFSVRYDGASNFGKENKYGTFFSVSGGWNIHNESFFESDIFNELKLKASYGSVGNRPENNYPQYDRYELNHSYTGIVGAIPDQLGNQNLGWEKSFNTNVGLDFRVFERVNVNVEYYDKNTSDLLYNVKLPAVSGYTGIWRNVGKVNNNGVEFNVDADIFDPERAFQWNVGLNMSFNHNEIKRLEESQDIDRGKKIIREGKDYDSWYLRKWAGVDPDNGEPLWETVDEETGEREETHDYNKATKQIVGTSSPDFRGGLNSNMTFKNFSLGLKFTFVKGGELYNQSRELFDADGTYPTFNQQKLRHGWSRWEEPGDEATHPELVYGGNNSSNQPSSRYLESRSYLRLRNLRFGYSFPDDWVSTLKMENLEVFFSADNLFTVTDYSGIDPAVEQSNVAEAGDFTGEYPLPRRFMFGINLSF